MLAKQSIGMKGLAAEGSTIPYQLSFNPFEMTNSSILVTGPSTYVYLKIVRGEENATHFNTVHS